MFYGSGGPPAEHEAMDSCEDGMGLASDLIGASAPGPVLTQTLPLCLYLLPRLVQHLSNGIS